MEEKPTYGRRFFWPYANAKTVRLFGDFFRPEWNVHLPMVKYEKGFETYLYLPPGEYKYKFIVDGEKKYDPEQRKIGDYNDNVITVTDQSENDPLPAFLETKEQSKTMGLRELLTHRIENDDNPPFLFVYIETQLTIDDAEKNIPKSHKPGKLLVNRLRLSLKVFLSFVNIVQAIELCKIIKDCAKELINTTFEHQENAEKTMYDRIARLLQEIKAQNSDQNKKLKDMDTKAKKLIDKIKKDSNLKSQLVEVQSKIRGMDTMNTSSDQIKQKVNSLKKLLSDYESLQQKLKDRQKYLSQLEEEELRRRKFIYFLWNPKDLPCIGTLFEEIQHSYPKIMQFSQENISLEEDKPKLLFSFIPVITHMDLKVIKESNEWLKMTGNSIVVRVHEERSKSFDDNSIDALISSNFLEHPTVLKAHFRNNFDQSGITTEYQQELLEHNDLKKEIISYIDQFLQ